MSLSGAYAASFLGLLLGMGVWAKLYCMYERYTDSFTRGWWYWRGQRTFYIFSVGTMALGTILGAVVAFYAYWLIVWILREAIWNDI